MIDVAIYGASGQARSVCEIITRQRKFDHLRVVALIDDFIDEDADAGDFDGISIIGPRQWLAKHRNASILLGVGSVAGKRHLAAKVLAAGARFVEPIIDQTAGVLSGVEMGLGSYIAYGTYVGPGCRIGEHVSIMTNSSIGHDVTIADFCTICPTATISGSVVIEEGAFLGAGAVIVNGTAARPLVVGAGATVAAGAVVTKSVPAGQTVMGNPARPLRDLARRSRR
ncbi:PglD-related sugar-binding protein [Novosphingobium sp. Leaf2]|uniref:PglD-related sugar-binding protein n=1 Tax=Novosphingobium sp. Leaf2 TaxID=1735670 RepID=UPI0006FA29A4|nr:hypothetical protein [Novosphingobium sp. Leaf2]KQM18276.1 hypothetical protein ASE49_08605 [Novosphingobium sp. Leaf2]